ncbi:MAG: DUF362 domain-containing protein [Proteobacteria bacterium]|nr:DUF362 domain-containing protein [Pseudomonadota bacterium]
MDILNQNQVSAVKAFEAVYPGQPPYHPSQAYPEFPLHPRSNDPNHVFDAIRNSLRLLGLDSRTYGMPLWNPLGTFIQPGQTVVVKPNLVSHFNWGYKKGLTDTDSLITHGSVIRCMIDYVALALKNNGRIIIGDSPVQLSSWEQLLRLIHFDELADYCKAYYPGISLSSCDYRLERAVRNRYGVIMQTGAAPSSKDYLEIDLGAESLLSDLQRQENPVSFGVADYPSWRMKDAHNASHNKYLFPKQVLEADAVINLPKLKTHSKAGFTCALKNLVGINGHKDYLPHFRYGPPKSNGDEYPDGGLLFDIINRISHQVWDCKNGWQKIIYSVTIKMLKGIYILLNRNGRAALTTMGGGWHGNDTLWRTILDINRSFFYADAGGMLSQDHITQKNCFTLVDGIVGGEKLSPLLPSPKKTGFILAGFNPVAVDAVAATLMGLDFKKIKQINNAFAIARFPLAAFHPDAVELKSNFNCSSINDIIKNKVSVAFEPSPGYKGHIELSEVQCQKIL